LQFHPDSNHPSGRFSKTIPGADATEQNIRFRRDAVGCTGMQWNHGPNLHRIPIFLSLPLSFHVVNLPRAGGQKVKHAVGKCFFFKNGVFFFANSFSHSYPVYPLRSAKNVEMAPSVKPKIKGLLKFKQGLSSLLSICSLDYLRKISKTKSRETQIFIQDSPMAPSFLLNHLVALTIRDNFVRTSTQLVNTDTFTLPLMKDGKS